MTLLPIILLIGLTQKFIWVFHKILIDFLTKSLSLALSFHVPFGHLYVSFGEMSEGFLNIDLRA